MKTGCEKPGDLPLGPAPCWVSNDFRQSINWLPNRYAFRIFVLLVRIATVSLSHTLSFSLVPSRTSIIYLPREIFLERPCVAVAYHKEKLSIHTFIVSMRRKKTAHGQRVPRHGNRMWGRSGEKTNRIRVGLGETEVKYKNKTEGSGEN